MTSDNYMELMQSLNHEQAVIVETVKNWCNRIVEGHELSKLTGVGSDVKPFYTFVSG